MIFTIALMLVWGRVLPAANNLDAGNQHNSQGRQSLQELNVSVVPELHREARPEFKNKTE
jgi:hypothetical protein